jgi:hypothetical protein
MTRIISTLLTEDIDNCRFVRLAKAFVFESDVLAKAELNSLVVVPAGFIYDYESVPFVRGTNKRGGTAHDYLCRIDSDPICTKAQAAAVYFEIMEHCYAQDAKMNKDRSWWARTRDSWRSWIKWGTVYVAPGYFHKLKVSATYEEVAGI